MLTAVAGKVLSGVEVAQMMRSMSAGVRPASVERSARCCLAERRRRLALAGNVALANAGALDDPFVRRIDDIFHVAIGHNAFRKCGSEPANH